MPIESQPCSPVELFLFAHQDDEFGVFHAMDECRRQGRKVACAYLTRGVGGVGERRNEESLRVLGKLGVSVQDVVFAGDLLAIDDGCLHLSLDSAEAWIREWMGSFNMVERIHVVAWEGGHHDHDSLHALTVHVARFLGLLPKMRQFALYNHKGCPGPLFRVLSPLQANGPVEYRRIKWTRRLRHLHLCLQYPSQFKTWIGLFPFVLLHYLLDGRQALQPVSMERLEQRPHPGELYYEQRGFFEWERMKKTLTSWQAR